METKHTKGEWKVIEVDPQQIIADVQFTPRKRQVCGIATMTKGVIHESQRKANAKLIAAAPDLLKACQECLKVFDEAGIGAHFLTDAIKKATT